MSFEDSGFNENRRKIVEAGCKCDACLALVASGSSAGDELNVLVKRMHDGTSMDRNDGLSLRLLAHNQLLVSDFVQGLVEASQGSVDEYKRYVTHLYRKNEIKSEDEISSDKLREQIDTIDFIERVSSTPKSQRLSAWKEAIEEIQPN